jgi:hypothetical protein
MIPKALFAAVLLTLACSARAGDDIIPAPLPAARYQKMAQHSPFSPPANAAAAPVAPPAPVSPGWADKLKVTAIMQIGNRYLATVEDSDTHDHFLVDSDKENDHGMVLSGVQWSDKAAQMRVTVRHGAEFGQVSFDPNASMLAGGAPNTVNNVPQNLPNPGPPQIPGGGVIRPPPAPNFGGQPNFPGQNTPGIMRRPVMRSNPPNINTPRVPLPTPGSIPGAAANDDDDDN